MKLDVFEKSEYTESFFNVSCTVSMQVKFIKEIQKNPTMFLFEIFFSQFQSLSDSL